MIRPNSLSVRDDRRGIWLFSQRHYSRSINLLTRRNDFQDFQNFHFLTKSKIKPSDRWKVWVTKVWKRKMWSDQILCLSETIVVVFDFFPRRQYSRSINLLTSRSDFQDFQNFQFLTKSKIKPTEKCDQTKFFVCPRRSSWYLTFFPKTLFKVHKFAYKTEWFSGFSKFTFSNKIKNQAQRSLKSLRNLIFFLEITL